MEGEPFPYEVGEAAVPTEITRVGEANESIARGRATTHGRPAAIGTGFVVNMAGRPDGQGPRRRDLPGKVRADRRHHHQSRPNEPGGDSPSHLKMSSTRTTDDAPGNEHARHGAYALILQSQSMLSAHRLALELRFVPERHWLDRLQHPPGRDLRRCRAGGQDAGGQPSPHQKLRADRGAPARAGRESRRSQKLRDAVPDATRTPARSLMR